MNNIYIYNNVWSDFMWSRFEGMVEIIIRNELPNLVSSKDPIDEVLGDLTSKKMPVKENNTDQPCSCPRD